MPYTPLEWKDGPEGGTPISAANLNRMEQGIKDAHDVIEPHVNADTGIHGAPAGAKLWHDGDASSSLNTPSGYVKLPNGLILQWTRITSGSGSGTANWPISFPNACISAMAVIGP